MNIKCLEQEYSTEEVLKVLISLDASFKLKQYTQENLLFGHIKQNEPIPIRRYIDELHLQRFTRFLDLDEFTKNELEPERNKNFETLCFEIFRDKIDYALEDVPIYKILENKNNGTDIPHYKYGVYEYLKSIFPLFMDIIKTEVEQDFFTPIPTFNDKIIKNDYNENTIKLLVNIHIKKLSIGKNIERYIKPLPFITPFLIRLIKKHKGQHILINNDINSIDYKFNLFYCFHFLNDLNTNLLKLKMLKWEEKKRNK